MYAVPRISSWEKVVSFETGGAAGNFPNDEPLRTICMMYTAVNKFGLWARIDTARDGIRAQAANR